MSGAFGTSEANAASGASGAAGQVGQVGQLGQVGQTNNYRAHPPDTLAFQEPSFQTSTRPKCAKGCASEVESMKNTEF